MPFVSLSLYGIKMYVDAFARLDYQRLELLLTKYLAIILLKSISDRYQVGRNPVGPINVPI